jgi:hypothetical protein
VSRATIRADRHAPPHARLRAAAPHGCAGPPRLDASSAAGQATVELVAFLPLLLAVALAAAALLAAHAAGEQAGQAAQAGAIALLQDRDPREAARRALPDGAHARATIEVEGRRVTVTVRPSLPIEALAETMTARATAHAGPEPPP